MVAGPQAEAQCAYLEEVGLVEGVVTDDSDVFLFGAKHVYRHLFENKKQVAGERQA
jgi:5'-3' exonuclease